jgi:YegS/Rv2252/BmrU family lipid kinase
VTIDEDRSDGTPATAEAPAEPPRRPLIRVIWNPEAGSRAGFSIARVDESRLREALARAKLGNELFASPSATEIRTLAADAVSRGYDLVVAAGGDGTVTLVATELLGSETVLGILPAGSVMDIARSLAIPRDLDAAADAIATGVVRRVDVGEVGRRPFFEGVSVGMNASMFEAVESFGRGDWRATLRTIGVALRYRPARMQIDLDTGQVVTRALMVVVANGPYIGAAMTVAPQARLDDGLFDVRVFRHLSKPRLLRHLGSIAFGRYRYEPEVETYRSRFVRIDGAHPLPARADARDLGTTPIELSVRPAALSVVVPRSEGS